MKKKTYAVILLLILGGIIMYERVNWQNSPSTATPVSADNLNKMDKGIADIDSQLADIAFNVKAYGAKGDGITNDTLIIQKLIDDIASISGATLYLPHGCIFLVENIVLKCSVNGTGTLKLKPNSSITVPIGYDDINIENITIDGDVKSTGAGIDDYVGSLGLVVLADNVTIFNVKTKNTFGAGIRSIKTKNIKILLCDIRNTKGSFSDGIYLQSCTDAKVLYNKVQDVNRIGIVSEGNDEAKSYNPLVQGNSIINAYGNGAEFGGGEINGGIWLENTLGGKVLHNTIKQTNMRGIVINPIINDDKHYHYLVEGNTITDAEIPIALVQGSVSDNVLSKIDILNNSILGNYNIGINVGNRSDVTIDNCYFGSSADVRGLIVTYQSNCPINLTISNCSKGEIEYETNGVDIEFYNTGTLNVLIKDLIGQWSYSSPSRQIAGTIKAINTTFIFNRSVVSYLCNFLSGGKFDNCDFIFNTDSLISINTPVAVFNNCRFNSIDNTVRTLEFSYKAFDNRFIECVFERVNILDSTQDDAGNFKFLIKSTIFKEYGSNGAIKTAYYETRITNKWKILECEFYDSGANIPITKSRFDVTQLIVRNAISPTVSCVGTGLTITSEENTLVAS